MRNTIVIAGAVAQKPYHGGHTWVLLQYLLGFKRLGYDVLLLDQIDSAACVDEAGQPCEPERSMNLGYLRWVMEHFGLANAFALSCEGGARWLGCTRREVLERVERAALLINVMGFLRDEEVLGRAARRVFLDIDPGFSQMWHVLRLRDMFEGYDAYVTVGANVGRSGCSIPDCGLRWITTRPPIVLDEWPRLAKPRATRVTSVASWRGAYGPLEYQGQTYGLRVHEFRKFAPLPRMSHYHFELALDIHPSDARDLALLQTQGWHLANPRTAAGNPWRYRDYIQGSWAEFTVAKNMYVQSDSGWFSDRSACYLASGRPVIAQNTGITDHYPCGAGLLVFTTLDEARACVEMVASDYDRHAQAARALAEAYFDSDRVLGNLLQTLGVV
jgi:hypothetical protein